MPSADKTKSAPDNEDSKGGVAEQKRLGDQQSQATTEDFDDEGMGVAPKE
jgi:hypothetical protein